VAFTAVCQKSIGSFIKNMLMFIILSIILIQVCNNYRNNKIKIRYKICLVITSDIEQNADPRKSSSIIFVDKIINISIFFIKLPIDF
jgi:hypothetical protein